MPVVWIPLLVLAVLFIALAIVTSIGVAARSPSGKSIGRSNSGAEGTTASGAVKAISLATSGTYAFIRTHPNAWRVPLFLLAVILLLYVTRTSFSLGDWSEAKELWWRHYLSIMLIIVVALVAVSRLFWHSIWGKVAGVLAVLLLAVLVIPPLVDRARGAGDLIISSPLPLMNDVCDQKVKNTSFKKAAEEEVNPNGDCSFTFEVVRGCVIFSGPGGETEPVCAGQPAFGKVRKRVTTARRTTPQAELEYLLCMPGSPVNGWRCS